MARSTGWRLRRTDLQLAWKGISTRFDKSSLIYAYGTLGHVLRDPKYEGNGLKRLMENSRADLPWVDYQKLEQGYMVRNKIAHEDLVVKRDRFGNM